MKDPKNTSFIKALLLGSVAGLAMTATGPAFAQSADSATADAAKAEAVEEDIVNECLSLQA